MSTRLAFRNAKHFNRALRGHNLPSNYADTSSYSTEDMRKIVSAEKTGYINTHFGGSKKAFLDYFWKKKQKGEVFEETVVDSSGNLFISHHV